jgi:hypothetical protein
VGVKNILTKKLMIIAGLALALPVLAIGYKASATIVLNVPTTSAQNGTLAQRLAQHKTAYKAQLNLSLADQKTLAGKCEAAQTALTNLNNHDKPILDNRFQIYNSVVGSLSQLSDNLSAQGISSPGLATAQAKFVDTINKYLTDTASYQTAVQDTIALDCASDPIGFKASLLEVRKLRAQLLSDAGAIKVLQPSVKTAVNDVKKSLNSSTGSSQ